jgi:hypothetical protein
MHGCTHSSGCCSQQTRTFVHIFHLVRPPPDTFSRLLANSKKLQQHSLVRNPAIENVNSGQRVLEILHELISRWICGMPILGWDTIAVKGRRALKHSSAATCQDKTKRGDWSNRMQCLHVNVKTHCPKSYLLTGRGRIISGVRLVLIMVRIEF